VNRWTEHSDLSRICTRTIHLRRLWTSAFFWSTSRTVDFSLWFKNSGHVITFFAVLWFAKHWSHDAILVVPMAAKSGLPVSSFSHLCQSPEEGKISSAQFKIFYEDNLKRCKIHWMKKERFELITYQEFGCEVLGTVQTPNFPWAELNTLN